MTKQATFNKVVRHLRKQKKQAISKNSNGADKCQYLTPNGLQCAVGCLIPKKYLTPELLDENPPVYDPPVSKIVESLGHDLDLLVELQKVHDYVKPRGWEKELKRVAAIFRLTMPPKVAS